MRNRKGKSCLALAISALLFASACGAPADSGSNSPDSTSAEQMETAAPEGEQTEAAFEEKVYAEDDVVTLKLFADETWWPANEFTGRIADIVAEKCGIRFEVTVPTDSNQLNMMIASGDMGDLVCTGKFTRMCDPNICYNLDELAEQYGVDMNIHSVMRFVNTADDGNLYTQMVGFSPESEMKKWDKAVYEQAGMAFRQDIYEELGSPELKSLDDVESMLAQVKEKYPDIVPFAYNHSQQNSYIKILMGATNLSEGFIDLDGQAVPFILDPKLEDYFKLMNEWYLKGYMNDDYLAWTSNEGQNEMTAGNIFLISDYSNSVDMYNISLEEAGVEYRVTTDIGLTTSQPGAHWVQGTAGWRGMFIPKSCVDPERVFKFVLWAWSQEGQELLTWGEEGQDKDWYWSDDHTYPIFNYDFYNPDTSQGLKYYGWMCHDGKMNVLPDYNNGGTVYDQRKALTEIAEANPVLGMLRMSSDSNEQVIMTNLNQLYMNEGVNIIAAPSKEESAARYQQMIETARQLGADQLTEWANEKYVKLAEEYDKIKYNEE